MILEHMPKLKENDDTVLWHRIMYHTATSVPWVYAPWQQWIPFWPAVLTQQVRLKNSRVSAGAEGTWPGGWRRGCGLPACHCPAAGSYSWHSSLSPSPARQPSPTWCQSVGIIIHVLHCKYVHKNDKKKNRGWDYELHPASGTGYTSG